MPFSRFRRAREDVEVNLIPVMNLFVTLIPFLLLAAAFYHVGVIATSLPSQTDETSDIAAEQRKVTVNLLIQPEKIQLSATSAVLDEETLAGLLLDIPKTDKGFDLELLGKALHEIKLRYDKSDTVIVLPDDNVQYQDVVRILDTAREIKFNQGTSEEVRIPLFPVVVLSRKV
jgi:biopolymer transport protein ExbD